MMNTAPPEISDRAMGDRIRGVRGPRTARRVLRAVLAVVAGVGLLPHVVSAQPLPTTATATVPPSPLAPVERAAQQILTTPSSLLPTTTVAPTTTVPPPTNLCAITPANDENAISAAVAGCPNGSIVRFPAGAVYTVDHEIVVQGRHNLIIDGNGATFRTTAPNAEVLDPNWMIVDGTNLTVHNMVVEGNFKMTGPRSLARMQEAFPSGNHFNAGISVYGGSVITVRDATIRDTFGDGVLAAPSGILPGGAGPTHGVPDNVRFERLTISRTARMGGAFTGGTNMWFVDNHLSDSWYWGFDGEIDASGQPLRDIHIVGNTFDGVNVGAITIPAPGGPGDVDRIEIRGNRTTQAPDLGGSSPILINYWISPPVMQNIVVADNDVHATYDGIVFRDVLSGSATGNTIRKTTGPLYNAPPPAEPVRLDRSPGVTASGNTGIGY